MHKIKFLISTCFLLFCCVHAMSQEIKGNYAIKNLATGLLLRPLDANKKNETPIVGYTPTNWKCMTWNFKHLEENTYSLRNLFTNKTLQPEGPQIKEGTTLEQQPIDLNNRHQQWEFIPQGNNQFLIRLKNGDLYLTAGTGTNSVIMLAPALNNASQQWTIYEQDPVM